MPKSVLTRHRGAVKRSPFWPVGLIALAVPLLLTTDALAQRPFTVHDPFYRSETARRAFYDGLAATGEVSYRTNVSGTPPSAIGLSFRLDYRLTQRIDLNAFWDAAGTTSPSDRAPSEGGRTIVLSWVGLKYYWSVDNFDYAFRLAVDPSSDGRVGFPQLDVAFISTRGFSPIFSSDFAIGVRRVRKGYREFIPVGWTDLENTPLVVDRKPRYDIVDTRALGMELHFMWSYNLIFDPAASNLFVSLMGEGGQYSLFETQFGGAPRIPDTTDVEFDDELGATDYRGGVVWMRSGIEYNRPSYQVIPFMSIPLKQWAPDADELARMQLGLRLMLR